MCFANILALLLPSFMGWGQGAKTINILVQATSSDWSLFCGSWYWQLGVSQLIDIFEVSDVPVMFYGMFSARNHTCVRKQYIIRWCMPGINWLCNLPFESSDIKVCKHWPQLQWLCSKVIYMEHTRDHVTWFENCDWLLSRTNMIIMPIANISSQRPTVCQLLCYLTRRKDGKYLQCLHSDSVSLSIQSP